MFKRMEDNTIQVQQDGWYSWCESESALVNLLWYLWDNDMQLFGQGSEPTLYDPYTDKMYVVYPNDDEAFKNKEIVTLYPREMSNDDRVQYEEERGGSEYIWKTRIVTDVLWDEHGEQVENNGYDTDDVVVYDWEQPDRFVEILRKNFSWTISLGDNVTVEENGELVEVFDDGILVAYFMPY